MNTTQTTPARLLKKPLVEFFDRVSSPANLSKTLNRLVFDSLRQGATLLPDELENVHALLDLLLACQLVHGATFVVAEA